MTANVLTSGRLRRRKALSRRVLTGTLALTEALTIIGTATVLFAIFVRSTDPQVFGRYVGAVSAYVLFVWQSLYSSGLYDLNRYTAVRRSLPRLMACIWLSFLLLLFFAFALKISDAYSRTWAFTWLIGVSILIPAFRITASVYIRRSALSGALTKDIAIYGAGENGQRLVAHINSLHRPWLRIVGIFDDRTDRVPDRCAGLAVRGGSNDLIDYAQKHGCDEVLLAMPPASPHRYLQLINKMRLLPVNLRIIPDLSVLDVVNMPQYANTSFSIPTIDLLRKPVAGWGAILKRLMDVTLTGGFLLVAAPVIAIIAVLIKLDSPGPVFFRQKRYGFQNEIINVLKFRTMYVDCEDANAEKLTTRDDPRVTRVGAWLRRFSLDEVPQLINVLKGDMSLVGPRPHALQAKAGGKLYEEVTEAYNHRIRVKPGLTGWAQVNGWRGNTETERDLTKRVEFDLAYIDNWSLYLDLRILLTTFWIVFKGENSY